MQLSNQKTSWQLHVCVFSGENSSRVYFNDEMNYSGFCIFIKFKTLHKSEQFDNSAVRMTTYRTAFFVFYGSFAECTNLFDDLYSFGNIPEYCTKTAFQNHDLST